MECQIPFTTVVCADVSGERFSLQEFTCEDLWLSPFSSHHLFHLLRLLLFLLLGNAASLFPHLALSRPWLIYLWSLCHMLPISLSCMAITWSVRWLQQFWTNELTGKHITFDKCTWPPAYTLHCIYNSGVNTMRSFWQLFHAFLHILQGERQYIWLL